MDFEDFRKQRSTKFLEDHELNDDELEQLIEGKFKRARSMYDALRRQEDMLVEHD